MPKLYIIPTPIGNLEDITIRALNVLKSLDFLLAEDTRKTSILLSRYEIKVKMVSYHMHNEHKILQNIIDKIELGLNVGLVSDAGTPGISDPGFLIVRECVKHGIAVECLPGASAFVPALVNSGLPCDKFCFEGFLPVKKGRKTRLEILAHEPRTMVFYESPHKLLKTLNDLAGIFGNERQACVSRELSKIHEENVRGSLSEIIQHYEKSTVKGEIVIVVAGIDS
ncbi:MAG: 16S rRNA (cytidine(1402)-2'-O)-methyltransferase [Bacteroidetes bacterium]|nr:16S rRNA (cytidine(1402)-2'-O)-methyltransferase [Bacteroidota bacterium]